MKTFEQFNKQYLDQMQFGGLSEFNQELNRINRAMVRAMKREKGRLFLINPEKDPAIVEYKKGMVYTFSYDYMTPKITPTIKRAVEATKKQMSLKNFRAIAKAVDNAGGYGFLWV